MSPNKENFEKLEAYIDGALDAPARADVERQLAANPQLKKMVAELSLGRDWVRALPRAKAPESMVETFQGQLERSALLGESGPADEDVILRINRWPQFMSVAAIVLLALGLGLVVYKVLPGKKGSLAMGPSASESELLEDLTRDLTRDGVATRPSDEARKLNDQATGLPLPVDASKSMGQDAIREGEGLADRRKELDKTVGAKDAAGGARAFGGGGVGGGGGMAGGKRLGGNGTTPMSKGGFIPENAALHDATPSSGTLAQNEAHMKLTTTDPATDSAGGASASDRPLVSAQQIERAQRVLAGAKGPDTQLQPELNKSLAGLAEEPVVLLVNAQSPVQARKDVSDFLVSNKIKFAEVNEGLNRGLNVAAGGFNYGANLGALNLGTQSSNTLNIDANAASPTTNAYRNDFTTANATPTATPAMTPGNAPPVNGPTANSTTATGANFNNYNANNDHLNSAQVYTQNGAPSRTANAAQPPAPAGAAQQQFGQQLGRGNTQYGQYGATQPVEATDNNNTQAPATALGVNAGAPNSGTLNNGANNGVSNSANYGTPVLVTGAAPGGAVAGGAVAGGAYRVLLTDRQQTELNRYISRRGDQWAEVQAQSQNYSFARAQPTEEVGLDDTKRQLAEVEQKKSLAKLDAESTLAQRDRKSVEKAEVQEEKRQESLAGATAATPQARIPMSGDFDSAKQQSNVQSKGAPSTLTAKAKTAEGADLQGMPTTTAPADASSTAAAGSSYRAAQQPLPVTTPAAPVPGTALTRGGEMAADKFQVQLKRGADGEELHPVLIIFNEQAVILPATLPLRAPAAAAPTTQPAAGKPAETGK